MDNWDDYRYFLAVARQKSIRQASRTLGVSHSTVLRRITLFEEALGVRLFERMSLGYYTTEAGEELLEFAERIEEETLSVSRCIAGRDTRLSGKIRLTLPGAIASHLVMPDLLRFRELHPGIELEINTTYTNVDLSKREADVAIQVSNDPQEDLFGRRMLDVMRATYVSEAYLRQYLAQRDESMLSWIAFSDTAVTQQWVEKTDYPHAPLGVAINDVHATLEAVKAGVGMAILPCFVGDSEAGLYRMPPGTRGVYKSLWVLTHEDLRNTARIRVFLTYIAEAIENYRGLLLGLEEKTLPDLAP